MEIDPAVYEAATKYFGLVVPEPEKVSIMDARAWVIQEGDKIAESKNRELFDYVVHDCFSGGSVPAHMFTTRFWEDLSKVVKSEGVIAVVSAMIRRIRTKILMVQTECCRKTAIRFHESHYRNSEVCLPSMSRLP